MYEYAAYAGIPSETCNAYTAVTSANCSSMDQCFTCTPEDGHACSPVSDYVSASFLRLHDSNQPRIANLPQSNHNCMPVSHFGSGPFCTRRFLTTPKPLTIPYMVVLICSSSQCSYRYCS